MRACPVCGSAESLGMSPFPVLIVDGEFSPGADDLPPGEGRDGELTLAIRVECITCGHLMLFNAERYRTGDERSLCQGRQWKKELGANSDCLWRRLLRSPPRLSQVHFPVMRCHEHAGYTRDDLG
jgi:hypothetical protein